MSESESESGPGLNWKLTASPGAHLVVPNPFAYRSEVDLWGRFVQDVMGWPWQTTRSALLDLTSTLLLYLHEMARRDQH